MAKMFYSSQEAAARLGKGESDLKELVRAGTLREFRDAGKVNYKVQDVDTLAVKLAAAAGGPPKAAAPQQKASSGASSSGEIVLEAVEDSGVELAASGSDIVMLEEADSEETRFGASASKKAKEGTVVPSVGLNVFDDDELDEHVDPLAQTAVTDVAGLGLEGGGSGSGILDLSRESDDTSLGAELLEEIYTGDEGGKGTTSEMGEDTRAGLDEAIPAAEEEAEEAGESIRSQPVAAGSTRRVVTRVVEYEADPWSTGLTAGLVVAVVVMWVAGLAGAAMVRGVMPSLLDVIYSKLAIFSGVAVAAAGLAVGLTYFFCKKRAG